MTIFAHQNRVRCVVKNVDGRDVFRLVLGASQRLEQDMREIHAHNRVPVARHRIELAPSNRAAAAGAILHNDVLAGNGFEHRLL